MLKTRIAHLLTALSVLCLASCSETKDDFQSVNINDYLPLTPGKTITYQLDSVLFVNFGAVRETHTYIIKDSIDAQLTDNQGRPAYRVRRLYRDANNPSVWTTRSTYTVTPLTNTIELNENNLRFVKLTMPVKDLYAWSGNGYLPYEPFKYLYSFGNSDHTQLETWNYIYTDIEKPVTLGVRQFNNTITAMNETPDSTNIPVTAPSVSGNKTLWKETYAKGVGLVYREIHLIEYEAGNGTTTQPFYTGFELRMRLLEHN